MRIIHADYSKLQKPMNYRLAKDVRGEVPVAKIFKMQICGRTCTCGRTRRESAAPGETESDEGRRSVIRLDIQYSDQQHVSS